MIMQLTPEQQDIVEKAKVAGEKRMMLRFTAEQKGEWQEAVQQEMDGRDETIAHVQKIKAAAEQPGFFGDVRRAIALSNRRVDELAKEAGIDLHLLSDFRAGEADLPADALDRLLESLRLRLMLEIRR
jgi:hypothetical protein